MTIAPILVPIDRPSLKEMSLAAECLRLKAAIIDQVVKTAAAEEALRASRKQVADLTAALHRAHQA